MGSHIRRISELTRQDLADTDDPKKGDALIGCRQPWPGAIPRTVHDKLAEIATTVQDFGAVGDGHSHPLSDYFPYLPLAQSIYPLADRLSEEIDSVAIRHADAHGPAVFTGGTYLIDDLVLKNPPIFLGKTRFRVCDGASKGLTFQGESTGDLAVQGGFAVEARQNSEPCVLLTVQGRNWVIPKVRLLGKRSKSNGDIALRFTNFAEEDVACTHNHIGCLMVNGAEDGVKWDCDDKAKVSRGYASNNVVEHCYLLHCENSWHYNYTATDGSAQYFRNRLHHGYFEKSQVGLKFTGNAKAGSVSGVSQDWWSVNFDRVRSRIATDFLHPGGTLHTLGYGKLTSLETHGGHIRNIVEFQKQGPNHVAWFGGTIAKDPGAGIDKLGHQVRVSTLNGPWDRGFYFTDGSASPALKKVAFGASGNGGSWSHAWLGTTRHDWALRIELPSLGLRLGKATGHLAFFGSPPVGKPTVSGGIGGNAALASLVAALAEVGLITDETTP